MLAEKKKMATIVRKLITCHRMHHPRVFLCQEKNGGRRLIQPELTYKITLIGLKKYLETTTDWILRLVNKPKKQKNKTKQTKKTKFNK